MPSRIASVLVVAPLALACNPALAQETIPYETGEYVYAQPAPELDDDVVTESMVEETDAHGAARVIELRRAEPVPVYVRSGEVQPTGGAPVPQLQYVQPVGTMAPIFIPRPGQPPQPLLHAQPYLPAGTQLVTFDRNVWLTQCMARLDTYESDAERITAMRSLPGALSAQTRADGWDSASQCRSYLDSYMHRASAQGGATPYSTAGDYMLVPVTVMVPQRPVYRDGTPAN